MRSKDPSEGFIRLLGFLKGVPDEILLGFGSVLTFYSERRR